MFKRVLRNLFSIAKQDQIVFFGSGKVAFPSLKVLHTNFPKLQVVTQSSSQQRKVFNEVERYCEESNIPWSSPITSKDSKQKRTEEWSQYLSQLQEADFGVVCSYGYMLPSRLIQRFRKGLIVIHPSLLPKYRGGSPIFHAIANGETSSGVSYIEISKKAFDQGRILHQIETQISRKDDYSKIEGQLASLAATHLPHVLQNIETLRPGRLQNDLIEGIPAELLKAPLLKSKKVDLSSSAEKVYHLMRAFMTPKFHFHAKGNDIIIKVSDEYLDGEGEVGTFQVSGKKLFLRCGDRFIRVSGWYQPSKKELNPGIFIAEFIRSGKYPLQKVKIQ